MSAEVGHLIFRLLVANLSSMIKDQSKGDIQVVEPIWAPIPNSKYKLLATKGFKQNILGHSSFL
jgi:hypothetical protein